MFRISGLLAVLSLSACTAEELPPEETGSDCPQDTGYSPAEQPSDPVFAELPPVVVSSIPQAGDKAVNPGLAKISVTFSKPMAQSASWVNVDSWPFPESDNPLVNGRTATLDVQLEPDTTYVLGTNSEQFQNFVDQDGNPAVPWVLYFHTAPE